MGYADGFYYGQGRIICDTSTFSVGDTIRVRSMTDSSKVWNQQVATVGTALVFTVPCYDYYKICTVQTINDTPTEIGGVYKTVDYGQTLFIDLLDKTTLGGIQGILNAHQEYQVISIGDEVKVKVYEGGLTPVDWIFLVAGINQYESHEVILCKKKLVKNETQLSSYWDQYPSSVRRTAMTNIYNSIEEHDRALIKEKEVNAEIGNASIVTSIDYVWCPTEYEIKGSSQRGQEGYKNVQLQIFSTQASRVKRDENNEAQIWVTASNGISSPSGLIVGVGTDGSCPCSMPNSGYYDYYVPCFHLTADS